MTTKWNKNNNKMEIFWIIFTQFPFYSSEKNEMREAKKRLK